MVYFASHLFVCVSVDGKERLLEPKLLRSQQLAPPRFCVRHHPLGVRLRHHLNLCRIDMIYIDVYIFSVSFTSIRTNPERQTLNYNDKKK